MALSQAKYWKEYYDFKRENYNNMITGTVQWYNASVWNDKGILPLYVKVDRVKASNDPFITKGMVYADFSFSLADWNLCLQATPSTNLGSSTVSNDGGGLLKVTKTAHGLNNGKFVNFTATTFPSGLSVNTIYGVEIIDADNFYPLSRLDGSKYPFSTAGSGVATTSRDLPYIYRSATRDEDFQAMTTAIKDSTSVLRTGTATSFNWYNIRIASNTYLNFVDYSIDTLNNIVNVRGQYISTATAT